MKKLLLAVSLLLTMTLVVNAQCWNQPECVQEITLAGIISNKNIEGSSCFQGAAVIKNSVNFNNWNYLSFTGAFTINQTINMNNRANVYVNGSATFDAIKFNGGDTLFLDGAATIQEAWSNNSNSGSRNVIILSNSASLYLEGTEYRSGDIIKFSGNNSNEIDVISCNDLTLAVKLEYFRISGHVIGWGMADQSGIQSYTLQGAYDANNWVDIATVDANKEGTYIYDTTSIKYAGMGLLVLLLIVGIFVSGRKIKIASIAILLMAATFVSCSKECPKPDESLKYTSYRLAFNMQDGTVQYSKVISDKH